MQLRARTFSLGFVVSPFVIGCLGLGFASSPRADSPKPQVSQGSVAATDALWYWSAECRPSTVMGLEVLVGGRAIFRSSFPVCRLRPLDARRGPEPPTLVFSFRGGNLFQGKYRTLRSQTIEGNIWQAGAGPDQLLLGVSFSMKQQVLLNSLHSASPDRVSESKLDRGVVLRTYPMSGSRRK